MLAGVQQTSFLSDFSDTGSQPITIHLIFSCITLLLPANERPETGFRRFTNAGPLYILTRI